MWGYGRKKNIKLLKIKQLSKLDKSRDKTRRVSEVSMCEE